MRPVAQKALLFAPFLMLISCQDAGAPMEPDKPEIHVTTEGASVEISPAGGSATLKYEIVNPQGIDSLAVSLDGEAEAWFSKVDVEEFMTSGRVTFEAARNISGEDFETVVTFDYYYTKEDHVSATAIVSQPAEVFDYEFTGKAALCRYWGMGIATYDYEVILGDTDYRLDTPGATYYTINFCDNIETDNRLPGAGNYHFPEESNLSQGKHIYTGYCSYYKLDETGNYEEGPLQIWDGKDFTVEVDGDVYTISGDLFDQNGKHHRIYYRGKIDLSNMTILSDFREDVTLDLSGMHIEANISELYGWSNWCSMYIVPDSPEEGDPIIRAELYFDADDWTLVSSDYTEDDGMCNPFYFNGGHLWDRKYTNGTWIFSCVNVDSEGMYDFGHPQAPLVSGRISLSVSADGTAADVDFDCIDSQGNRITGKQDALQVSYF